MAKEGVKEWVPMMAVTLLILGGFVATLYSNNAITGRVAVGSPLVCLAAIMSMIEVFRAGNYQRFGSVFLLLSCAVGYFVLRALFSPVELLGNKDLFLFVPSFLVAFVCCVPANRRILARCLPWVLAGMIVVQAVPVLEQWEDPTYVPFREGLDHKKHISGFFGHRNFFALLMGGASLGLVCYSVFIQGVSARAWVVRGFFGAVSLLGFSLMFVSQSRGAWFAVMLAFAVLLGVYFVWRTIAKQGSAKGAFLIGGLSSLLVGAGAIWLGNLMAEKRGINAVEGFFFANSRNDLLLLASDCEPTFAVVGGGARFFEYESRRVWDYAHLNNTIGDPQVVHNEYIEAFVNYGYVGMLLLLLLMAVGLVLSLWQIILIGTSKLSEEKRLWLAMQFTALGFLIAIGVQSLVDFSFHLLPLILLFGGAIGCILKGDGPKWTGKLALSAVPFFMIILGLKAYPYWANHISEERAKSQMDSEPLVSAATLRLVGERTGNVEVTKRVAEILLENVSGSEENLKEAIGVYELAHRQHPFDGGVLVTLARLEALRENWAKALRYIEQAIVLVGASEHRYGAHYWKSLIVYQSERENLVSPYTSLAEIEQRITVLQGCVKCFSGRFYGVVKNQLLEKEVRALLSLYRARWAAQKAVTEGAVRGFERALAYVSYAQKQYASVDRFKKGFKQQTDLKTIILLRQQKAFMEKRKVKVDDALLKALESEDLSL